jgi:hypothetical protein
VEIIDKPKKRSVAHRNILYKTTIWLSLFVLFHAQLSPHTHPKQRFKPLNTFAYFFTHNTISLPSNT